MDINNKDRIAAGEELIKHLRYEPENGNLYWTERRANRTDLSKPAGILTPEGYIQISISINRKQYLFRAHQLIWRMHHGVWSELHIDHLNRTRNDNRLENLRLVSHQENMMNQGMKYNNKLGYQNISVDRNGYSVRVMINYKVINRKYFRTLEQAISHRDSIRAANGFPPATDRPAIAAE